ncbi:MAG: hypothetical protein ACON4H_12170 [Rubripirellula sp.]
MGNMILHPASEHVLVETTKDQGCEGLLQMIVLCGVNPYDHWLLTVPKALLAFGRSEEAIVLKFLKSSQQRLESTVRLRLRLSLQNTAALPTLILSLNLVQRPGGSHSILQIERTELHDGKLVQFASDGVLTMAVEQGGWLNFALPSAVNNNSRLPRYMSW